MRVRVGLIGAAVSVLTVIANAAPPSITQTSLACVSSHANAKISATVSGQPSSVRVYFHSAVNPCGDYYVDMQPDPANHSQYTAVLPIIARDAGGLVYQIRAKGATGSEIASPVVTAPVRDDCASPGLTANELQRAKAIVLGLTGSAQNAAPCKFSCLGVTNVITAAGDLKPDEQCASILAGKPFFQTPQGEAAAAAAGLLGAAAGYELTKPNNATAPSPARP